jgi:hypothetical protein
MYFFLVGDNRIHRYVTIDDVVQKKSDPFINYLYEKEFDLKENQHMVVDFTNYKTKQNKMMAHIIISDSKKELTRVIAFPAIYSKALGKMRPESKCEIKIGSLEDGTKTVREIL